MNIGIVAKVLGFLTLGLAAVGKFPLLTSLIAGDSSGPWPWMAMIAASLTVGCSLIFLGRKAQGDELGIREGIAVTSAVWIIGSLLSAIGIRLATPEVSYMAAWFESMSGFTTTGSTVFGHSISIDHLTHGVWIWRAITQWLGGLGIVVISLSLLPLITGAGGFSLYRAEVPGISNERLAPRIADTARLLLFFYSGITIAIVVALILTGSKPFFAVCHAMSTVATGGFSPYSNSIDGMNSSAGEWVLCVGMLMGGLNFALLLAALRGKPVRIWQNAESKVFISGVLILSMVTALIVGVHTDYYDGDYHALFRHSAFNVISTATSTGFAVGYDMTENGSGWGSWPAAAQIILVSAMLVGGCTGGTAGGMKVIRFVVAWKALRGELRKSVEPMRISAVTIDDKPLPDRVTQQISSFFFIFVVSWALGAFIIAAMGHDLATSMGAALTCLTNNGPGFGEVSVEKNFGGLDMVSQGVCIALMLIGRLEFFGIIALCSWRHWQR